MLSLLLDENLSEKVAAQVAGKRPEISIIALRRWEGGRFLGADDADILGAAAAAGLTLVTYGQWTIPPLLMQFAGEGIAHGGIVFVDDRTIPSHDLGGLVRALIQLWEAGREWEWTDRVVYLRAAPR